jgi:hypothetical protein
MVGLSRQEPRMRDICADLRDRANLVVQQINSENIRFESLIAQLRAEHDNSLGHLRAQLRLANKLLEFTVWQSEMRAALAARIAVAEEAENLIKNSIGQELKGAA